MSLLDDSFFKVYAAETRSLCGLDSEPAATAIPPAREPSNRNEETSVSRQPAKTSRPTDSPRTAEPASHSGQPLKTSIPAVEIINKRHKIAEETWGGKIAEPTDYLIELMSRPATSKSRTMLKTQETPENAEKPAPRLAPPPIVAVLESTRELGLSAEIKLREIDSRNLPQPDALLECNNIRLSIEELRENFLPLPGLKLAARSDSSRWIIAPPQEETVANVSAKTALRSMPEMTPPDSDPIASENPMRDFEHTERSAVEEIGEENEEETEPFVKSKEILLETDRFRKVAVVWPRRCEQLRKEAAYQIEGLADHLESKVRIGQRVIAFCGNASDCGCTTLLLCSARELAVRGLKTIIIDGHFENPSLARMLRIPGQEGWDSLFFAREPRNLSDIVLRIAPNLDLLPLSAYAAETRGREIPSDVFFQVFGPLLQHYEIALIDSGNFRESGLLKDHTIDEKLTEVANMGADGILLVFGGEIPGEELSKIERRMRLFDIPQIGIAENGISRPN